MSESGLSHSRLVALAHPCAPRHKYVLYVKPLLQAAPTVFVDLQLVECFRAHVRKQQNIPD